MNLVFDSSALIAYLRNEDGVNTVEELLLDMGNACCVHAVNLCEVYYEARRRGGEERAQAALIVLHRTGLLPREDMDEDFWQHAGRIKADYRRISLADCFCAALAVRLAGEVVTADREFEPIAAAGACQVRFIR
ncbi:MAG: PIN domain-containing protein [Armatimonadota bacterium]